MSAKELLDAWDEAVEEVEEQTEEEQEKKLEMLTVRTGIRAGGWLSCTQCGV